jgi:hypothetical protein
MTAPRGRPFSVLCPKCGQPTPYTPENPARPFCSLRCRSIDLGAWAAEGYRVADPSDADSDAVDDPKADPRH